ncbi:MAG: hypothetical protein MI861_19900, partial [Pirellulales bacterium]|nr:hypothetical protein [Pirellulales bacterium]
VFIGGWGAAQYQYGFEGTYHNSANRELGRLMGNTDTAADDVIVDGNIITAENYDSASELGRIVAQEVIARTQQDAPANNDPAATDQAIVDLV